MNVSVAAHNLFSVGWQQYNRQDMFLFCSHKKTNGDIVKAVYEEAFAINLHFVFVF